MSGRERVRVNCRRIVFCGWTGYRTHTPHPRRGVFFHAKGCPHCGDLVEVQYPPLAARGESGPEREGE